MTPGRARVKVWGPDHFLAMAENRKATKGGYFYLSRAQLFIVAVAFVIASTVFFFLGVLIGQSIEERKLLHQEEPVVKIPIQPDSGSQEEELTFYDTLTQAEGVDDGPSDTATGEADGTPKSKATASSTTSFPSWSLQVTAFQNKDDAIEMASELDGEGYSAFVVSGQVKGKTWHRVRVGKYASKEAAMMTLKKLRDVDRYRNAIITRDN